MIYFSDMKTTTYFRMSIAVLTLAAAQTQADITITSWAALKSALQNKNNDGETTPAAIKAASRLMKSLRDGFLFINQMFCLIILQI